MKPISPLLLSAQISPPAGGGSFGLADTTKLENPYQAPMWLDEIRFSLVNSTGVFTADSFSSLSVELKLGEVPITKGFVPLSLIGKVLNDNFSAGGSQAIFTWRLPKPLFIPAKELLRPTIYFAPFSGAPSTNVNITYCCRPLPKGTPPPAVLQIPWVTSYVPASLTFPVSADVVAQSSPSDLYNPFDQDMHVQRFVGRLLVQGNNGEISTWAGLSGELNNLTTGAFVAATMVTAQDSFNNILVRDPTPFLFLFNALDRSWTVNSVLPPKGFYLFTIDQLWSGYVPNSLFYTNPVVTVGIGMVGWREVPNRV